MAITKSQLKSIIKECLVEILSEGLGQSAQPMFEAVKKKAPTTMARPANIASVLQQNASKTRLGPTTAAPDPVVHNLREAIKRESGGNSIMADILADTAANSLPAMLESDRSRTAPLAPVGTVERVVASTTPDQLFGEEAASKWAALAFMDSPKK